MPIFQGTRAPICRHERSLGRLLAILDRQSSGICRHVDMNISDPICGYAHTLTRVYGDSLVRFPLVGGGGPKLRVGTRRVVSRTGAADLIYKRSGLRDRLVHAQYSCRARRLFHIVINYRLHLAMPQVLSQRVEIHALVERIGRKCMSKYMQSGFV